MTLPIIKVADNKIMSLGNTPFTLTRISQSEYVSGGTGDYTNTETSAKGLCYCKWRSGTVSKSFIEGADVKILISPIFEMVPSINDSILIDEETFTLIQVGKSRFKGKIVLYVCFARRN